MNFANLVGHRVGNELTVTFVMNDRIGYAQANEAALLSTPMTLEFIFVFFTSDLFYLLLLQRNYLVICFFTFGSRMRSARISSRHCTEG